MPLSRSVILQEVKKRAFYLPDLQECLAGWPSEVSSDLCHLQGDLDDDLCRLFLPGLRREKMRQSQVAYFAASWWPYAPYDRLVVASKLSIWLFAWDDETDTNEFATLASNYDAAQTYRQKTWSKIQTSLKLVEPGDAAPTHDRILDYFDQVGDGVSSGTDKEVVDSFAAELRHFLDMTSLEQKLSRLDSLPSAEEYLTRRMGSGAVGVCLPLTEYCFNMALPDYLRHSEHMRSLWMATNLIICIMNDILSMKKEIKQGQVDSLLPIILAQCRDSSKSVRAAVGLIRRATATFEQASAGLHALTDDFPDQQEMAKKYVKGCRLACTANLNWSLKSGRYLLTEAELKGIQPLDLD